MNAMKLLVLPTVFILPWLWIKLADQEAFIRETLANHPLWAVIALLPGVVVFVVWIGNQLRR